MCVYPNTYPYYKFDMSTLFSFSHPFGWNDIVSAYESPTQYRGITLYVDPNLTGDAMSIRPTTPTRSTGSMRGAARPTGRIPGMTGSRRLSSTSPAKISRRVTTPSRRTRDRRVCLAGAWQQFMAPVLPSSRRADAGMGDLSGDRDAGSSSRNVCSQPLEKTIRRPRAVLVFLLT